MGVYFGFIKKNQFLLSLEGAEFLNKLNMFQYLFVNDDGEKSVLYGNHIMKKFFNKRPKFLKRKVSSLWKPYYEKFF